MNHCADHDKFAELCALSTSGTLSPQEQKELLDHLADCPDCRKAYREYCALASDVIPLLAEVYEAPEIVSDWDSASVRSRLVEKLKRETAAPRALLPRPFLRSGYAFLTAACLLVAIGISSYEAGKYKGMRSVLPSSVPVAQASVPPVEKSSLESQLRESLTAMDTLQQQSVKEKAEADRLQLRIQEMDVRIDDLSTQDRLKDEQAKALINERDALVQQLRNSEEKYKTVEEELGRYQRLQRDAQVRTASLESNVKQLSSRISEQEKAIKDREDYLASDRDIRELIGARHLYIADVYDIDKNGRPRSSFGRVFYTVDKSLVFYAFDLDHGATLKNSTFQAWGHKDLSPQKLVSLGIFYMDSAANRRWVLRTDDPAKIAQIDAIFVTAEPGGGSQKPSGKPFLFASLHQPPNHP